MHRIFYPRSIVVIGVSEKPDNLARTIILNLRTFGYSGALYAVDGSEERSTASPSSPRWTKSPTAWTWRSSWSPAPWSPA